MISVNALVQNRHNLDLHTKVVQSKSYLSAIVGMLVPFDNLNGLAVGCYQPSPW